jgi:hypothetical protein
MSNMELFERSSLHLLRWGSKFEKRLDLGLQFIFSVSSDNQLTTEELYQLSERNSLYY